MKIGIVTCAEYPQLTEQEKPLLALFRNEGIEASPLIWNDPSINWTGFDCLMLRSIWDYHLQVDQFFAWLAMLEENNIKTFNSMAVVNWNRHKFYLQELESKGVKIIPTVFVERTNQFSLNELIQKDWQQAVIKPAVSANAHLTESFTIDDITQVEGRFKSLVATRDFLVQTFMPEIQTMGEVSLIFFDKAYSHAVLKTPARGDFRVQADHGGSTVAYQPSESVIEAGRKILSLIHHDLLYARIDGVVRDNQFYLMELELIEPELFFHLSEGSHQRFAHAAMRFLRHPN
jgi:glutathione synthase/RimK-type ligase-like ATP-grasp enzyme